MSEESKTNEGGQSTFSSRLAHERTGLVRRAAILKSVVDWFFKTIEYAVVVTGLYAGAELAGSESIMWIAFVANMVLLSQVYASVLIGLSALPVSSKLNATFVGFLLNAASLVSLVLVYVFISIASKAALDIFK